MISVKIIFSLILFIRVHLILKKDILPLKNSCDISLVQVVELCINAETCGHWHLNFQYFSTK